MKNNCSLFDRLFKKKKIMTFSFLEYLFSFCKYGRFSIMQIRKVMTSEGVQLKFQNTE